MGYGLWLLSDDTGRITLNGYAEIDPDPTAPPSATRTEHWPSYPLCNDRTELSETLDELGLELAAGANLNDLDKKWDVYLRHPDIESLRATLDQRRAARK